MLSMKSFADLICAPQCDKQCYIVVREESGDDDGWLQHLDGG